MIRCYIAAALLCSISIPVSAQAAPAGTDSGDVASDRSSASDTQTAEIVVTGSVYRGNVATGGARIAAPIRDLPLSITSVSKELIDDRQVRNIRQLADNVAGVQTRSGGAQNFGLDFDVRGLQFGSTAFNGFRNGSPNGFDTQIVERVEFIKGPASVLYGATGSLSGLVNVVTKTPQRDAFVTIEGIGGQYGYGRGTIDANAPLADDLQVRLNGAIQTANALDAFTKVQSQSAAPAIAWSPVPGIKLEADFIYFHGRQPTRLGQSRLNTPRLLDLPFRFKLTDKGDRNIIDNYSYHVDASWNITPDLTLREGFYLNRSTEDEIDIPGFARDLADSTGMSNLNGSIYTRDQYSVVRHSRDLSSQTELRWIVTIGPTKHKLLAGFEHAKFTFLNDQEQFQPFPSLDLNNPIYRYPIQPRIFSSENFSTTTSNAPYAQDFIEIGKHWKVLAGLRYDFTTSTYAQCNTARGCTGSGALLSSIDQNALSPRAGVVWQPNGRTTLYFSWSKSFVPAASLDRFGKVLPAERGTQYEVGIRQDILDQRRLNITLAAYDLTRQNIQEQDPVDFNYSVAIGEQRVKGIEVELAGKPVPWIDLIGAYSYIDGEVTKSETALTGIPRGIRLPEIPHHTASLFSRVTLVPLGLPDTSVGVGVYYTSTRPTRDFYYPYDPSFTAFAPTTRVDLSFYQVVSKLLRLQANITNLLDERIFEPQNQGSYRTLPFTATGGFRLSF